MQKRFFLLTGLFSLLILNISCDKDNDDPPPPAKTKTELLTAAPWKYEKIDPAAAETYINCFIDNVVTFTADGKGTCPDSGTQCNPPTGNFNWNFTDNETKLHLDATLIPAGSNDFTIVTLNETNLVASQDITSPVGPIKITITFKH
jgi:hypothetical protein